MNFNQQSLTGVFFKISLPSMMHSTVEGSKDNLYLFKIKAALLNWDSQRASDANAPKTFLYVVNKEGSMGPWISQKVLWSR